MTELLFIRHGPTDWTEAWVAIESGYGASVRSRALTDPPAMPDDAGTPDPHLDGRFAMDADVIALRTTDRHALITVRQALQGVECELEIEPTGTSFIGPG